jgi:hypothetical protein
VRAVACSNTWQRWWFPVVSWWCARGCDRDLGESTGGSITVFRIGYSTRASPSVVRHCCSNDSNSATRVCPKVDPRLALSKSSIIVLESGSLCFNAPGQKAFCPGAQWLRLVRWRSAWSSKHYTSCRKLQVLAALCHSSFICRHNFEQSPRPPKRGAYNRPQHKHTRLVAVHGLVEVPYHLV